MKTGMVIAKIQEPDVEHSIERRTSRRFQIALPILFRWTNSIRHYDVGQCENIGGGGMFVLSKNCPPVGAEIEVEFAIPAFDLVPHAVKLRGVGRVCRVDLTGFAIAGEFVNKTETQP